jgi:GNAT superfamily N-acetyltransferase
MPVPLNDGHDLSEFSCGDDDVDRWLHRNALSAQRSGSARTYVVCEETRVAAFYCLSNASFEREELGSACQRRGLPRSVPAILLGQLGVDQRYAGRGLGPALVKDAMGRALHVSETSGVVVLHLHASSDAARDFYFKLDLGFHESKTDPRTLYLPLQTIRMALLPE